MTTSGWPLGRTAVGESGATPVESFAICLDCGADIDSWRERLLPLKTGTFTVTKSGALALQVEHRGACDECGGGRAEIRVEARPKSARDLPAP